VSINKLAFGGGCHWCTEAVFQSLVGVEYVHQGWAAHIENDSSFSEAALIEYNPETIELEALLEIHLLTHSSTSNHSMRNKYRSAVYVTHLEQEKRVACILEGLRKNFNKPLQTQILPLAKFKSNPEYQNYYYQNPNRAFCRRYIDPKLVLILERFPEKVKRDKVNAALNEDG